MNTRVSDAAVEAACQSCIPEGGGSWRELYSPDEQAEHIENMRSALEAALPYMHQEAEFGNARAQFDAWAKSKGYSVVRLQLMCDPPKDGGYANEFTHDLWNAWQAALAATSKHGDESCASIETELQFYREHIGNDLDNLLMDAGVMKITHEGGYEACWKNTMEAVERLCENGKRQSDALASFVLLAEQRKAEIGELSDEMEKCLQDGVKALAPTGEQQGRERAQFEDWAKSAGLETKIYAHNEMHSHPVTRGAWMAWQHLAARQTALTYDALGPARALYDARQTVGQHSPELLAAARDFYNSTVADTTVRISCQSAEQRERVTASGERLRAALVAPTAQGVDLMQFRETVHSAILTGRVQDFTRMKALLALIDGSKAVQS